MRIDTFKFEREEDLREISELLKKVYVGEGYTPPEIAEQAFLPERLVQSEYILTAKLDHKIVGLICGVTTKSNLKQVAQFGELEIQNLAVDCEYRRLKIAKKLCIGIQDQAIGLGYKKLVLGTLPSMSSAHSLYRSLGFHRSPSRDWKKNDREFLAFEKVIG